MSNLPNPTPTVELEAQLKSTRDALAALRMDVSKARGVLVEALYEGGYDREGINGFIDEVNSKTRFFRWERESTEFNATIRFEITVEVNGIDLENRSYEEVDDDRDLAAELICGHLGIGSLDDFDVRYIVDYDPYVVDADVTEVTND